MYELFLYGERNSLKKFLFKESFCGFPHRVDALLENIMVFAITGEYTGVALALHKQGIVLHYRFEVGFQVSSFKAGTNALAFFMSHRDTY